MNMSKQAYQAYVKEISPPSPLGKNMLCAFLVGGAICTVGQFFSNWYTSMDMGKDAASTATSVTMIFLGALLTRMGEVELSYPGGCELGPRPIDLHLSGLRELGAEIREEGGFLHCRAPRLRGREVVLRMPSVGATENLMLAACGCEGPVTVLGSECVAKSYPAFWEDFASLREDAV